MLLLVSVRLSSSSQLTRIREAHCPLQAPVQMFPPQKQVSGGDTESVTERGKAKGTGFHSS